MRVWGSISHTYRLLPWHEPGQPSWTGKLELESSSSGGGTFSATRGRPANKSLVGLPTNVPNASTTRHAHRPWQCFYPHRQSLRSGIHTGAHSL
jgi:hypothetical protein